MSQAAFIELSRFNGLPETVETAMTYLKNQDSFQADLVLLDLPSPIGRRAGDEGLRRPVLLGGLREMGALHERTHLAHAFSSGRSLKPSPNPLPEGEGHRNVITSLKRGVNDI